MLAPYLLGNRGPGAYLGASGGGGGGGGGDGGFVDEPIVTTTASGNTTISGKVKPGSFGKFVFPLASITAGGVYTFRYTPHFSQLTKQGKLAMVGFGLKNNNDFNIVGLRGDGTTGLKRYKVSGTPPNGWNKQTGHTETDGGAPTNGTQAGPNYIRLFVSSDGTAVTFQTSGTSGSTWDTEFTAFTPAPYSNISSVTTFGIALWFNNADTGPFSIDIDQFATAVFGTFIGAIAKNNSDSGSSNFNSTTMTWAAELVDTDAFHDTGSNTGRLTIPSAMNNRYGIISATIYLTSTNGNIDGQVNIVKTPVATGVGVNSPGGLKTFRIGSGAVYAANVSTAPQLLLTNDFYTVTAYCDDTSVVLNGANSALCIRVIG